MCIFLLHSIALISMHRVGWGGLHGWVTTARCIMQIDIHPGWWGHMLMFFHMWNSAASRVLMDGCHVYGPVHTMDTTVYIKSECHSHKYFWAMCEAQTISHLTLVISCNGATSFRQDYWHQFYWTLITKRHALKKFTKLLCVFKRWISCLRSSHAVRPLMAVLQVASS